MLTTRPQSYIEAKQTGVRLSNIIKGTTKDLCCLINGTTRFILFYKRNNKIYVVLKKGTTRFMFF